MGIGGGTPLRDGVRERKACTSAAAAEVDHLDAVEHREDVIERCVAPRRLDQLGRRHDGSLVDPERLRETDRDEHLGCADEAVDDRIDPLALGRIHVAAAAARASSFA